MRAVLQHLAVPGEGLTRFHPTLLQDLVHKSSHYSNARGAGELKGAAVQSSSSGAAH